MHTRRSPVICRVLGLLLAVIASTLPLPVAGAYAQAATSGEIENLVAFTRLLGVVEYFHPSDQVARMRWLQWQGFVVHAIPLVEGAPDATHLRQRLVSLFTPYAPTLRIVAAGTRSPAPLPSQMPPQGKGDRVVQWRYAAFGVIADVTPFALRQSAPMTRGTVPHGFADPAAPFRVDLGDALAAYVPLALYRDAGGTRPHVAHVPKRYSASFSPTDRTVWLADIAFTWNALEHFYPYWDTLSIDWPGALRNALAACLAASGPDAFYGDLRSMVALLDDGHADTYSPLQPSQNALLPVNWDWIDKRLVVVHTDGVDAGAVRIGDTVTAVDGRQVADIMNAPDNATGGTLGYRRWTALVNLRLGPSGSHVSLELQHPDGAPYTATLTRGTYPLGEPEPRPASAITSLAPGIMYLDVTRFTDAEFQAALPDLTRARGIVIDSRGYPQDYNGSVDLYGHLMSAPGHSGILQTPIVKYPDHQRIAWHDDTEVLPAVAPHIGAKLVFLIDPDFTVSRAEHLLVLAEGYHLGALVGSTTGGANGEPSEIKLPGGYDVYWTGIRARKVDGSQLMHVGIAPTVPAERTVAGVIAGKDEILETGLSVLHAELGGSERTERARASGAVGAVKGRVAGREPQHVLEAMRRRPVSGAGLRP